MTRPEPYRGDDERTLRAAFRNGESLDCPRCMSPLDLRKVPPRNDVSYVRDRIWVTCATCHRTMVLDRRQPE